MTREELMKALGDVDLKYIEEAAPGNQVTSSNSDELENEETDKVVDISSKAAEIRERRKRRSNLPRIIVFAAAACLVGAIAIRTINSGIFFMGSSASAPQEQAAALEEAVPEAAAEEVAEAAAEEVAEEAAGAVTAAEDEQNQAVGAADTDAADDGKESQIPNPFVDCENLEEAEALAGFMMTVPASLEEAADAAGLTGGADATGSEAASASEAAAAAASAAASDFRAVAAEMIEVIYRNDGGDEVFRIRKSAGEGDISGDYTDYTEITNITVNGKDVTIKGMGDENGYSVATWDDGLYSFSITAEAPLGVEYLQALIAAVG